MPCFAVSCGVHSPKSLWIWCVGTSSIGKGNGHQASACQPACQACWNGAAPRPRARLTVPASACLQLAAALKALEVNRSNTVQTSQEARKQFGGWQARAAPFAPFPLVLPSCARAYAAAPAAQPCCVWACNYRLPHGRRVHAATAAAGHPLPSPLPPSLRLQSSWQVPWRICRTFWLWCARRGWSCACGARTTKSVAPCWNSGVCARAPGFVGLPCGARRGQGGFRKKHAAGL